METGKPILVASVSHKDDPTRAQSIPSMSTEGFLSNSLTSITSFRIVSATREPARTAPPNSQTVAINMACIMVKDLDETEVANELATSFAPMFQASRNAKIKPKAKM